jgi:AFG3 family protein
MNDIIGPVSYGGREGAREGWQKPFSEKTAEMLDFEVRKMITLVFLSYAELAHSYQCIALLTSEQRIY